MNKNCLRLIGAEREHPGAEINHSPIHGISNKVCENNLEYKGKYTI
jgi:hypothetical protein